MRKLIIALLLLAPLTACNTVQGFGKDLSKVGESIDDAAEDSK